MKKNTLLFTLMVSLTIFAQNSNGLIDAAGDVMVVALDSNGDHNIAFVLLDDAPDGTTINFDDDEWTGSSFDTATGEGHVTWTNNTGSTIAAGKVIKIYNASNNNVSITASIGTAAETDSGFNLGSTNDHVYVYTGTTRAAYGTLLTFAGSLTSSAGPTLSGTGLTNGVNAINPIDGSSSYIGRYTGPTEFNGTIAEVSAALSKPANWTIASFTFSTNVIGDLTGSVFGTTTLGNDLLSIAKASVYSDGSGFVSSDESLTLEVYNTLGQKVSNHTLVAGVYIVKLTNAKGQVATLKKVL